MSRRLLICTDLDRTLIPNGNQPESPGARARFAALVARPEVTLVFVTGRHRALVERAVRDYDLPQPDFVVGDVGASIHERRAGHWRVWQDWEAEIAPDWGGIDHDALRALFAGLPGLRLQAAERQARFKLSYQLSLPADPEALLVRMRERLSEAAVRAELVWSIDETAAEGLLDVLPAAASKYRAVDFLRGRLGVAASATVFAGDSGNDLSVLASPLNSVLVANATDPVRRLTLAEARKRGNQDALYLARGGLLGMNGNYSAGILEGIVHFLPHTRSWVSGVQGLEG